MDIGTFIVRIVEALVWPTVIGLVFWNERGHVGTLIGSVQRLKWKDTEVTFGKQLDRVEDELTPAAAETIEKAPELEKLVAEAQLPPAYIVQQAWLHIERAVEEVTRDRIATTTGNRLLRYAQQVQHLDLSPDDERLIRELRQLRNDAVHSTDLNLTVTDALRYKDLAESLARGIKDGKPSS
jgi:hypothetical protein